MTFFRSVTIAAVAILLAILSTTAALATEAAATTALNVRSGPSTSFSVVDTLLVGEIVEVTECEEGGWCYIEHTGANGWVSSTFLTMAPTSEGPADPECSLAFTIGPAGPTLSIVCGDAAVPIIPPATPSPAGDQACFYTNLNYGGAEFCYGIGTLNTLDPALNDKISSVKLSGAAKAQLCVNTNLGGYCRTVTGNVPVLGLFINNQGSSLMVFTGSLPTPAPVTFSTGPIDLQQTYMANLDNGAIGGAGVDIFYEAITAMNKRIAPRNGAQLALGDGSNRGYDGCSVASFTTAPISIWVMPVGSYVCAKTSEGRISQFRLNGYTGTTMNLGYTTWD